MRGQNENSVVAQGNLGTCDASTAPERGPPSPQRVLAGWMSCCPRSPPEPWSEVSRRQWRKLHILSHHGLLRVGYAVAKRNPRSIDDAIRITERGPPSPLRVEAGGGVEWPGETAGILGPVASKREWGKLDVLSHHDLLRVGYAVAKRNPRSIDDAPRSVSVAVTSPTRHNQSSAGALSSRPSSARSPGGPGCRGAGGSSGFRRWGRSRRSRP